MPQTNASRSPRPSPLLSAFGALDAASAAIEEARRSLLALPEAERSGRLRASVRDLGRARDEVDAADSHLRAYAAPDGHA